MPKIYDLNTVIDFGKFKGKTLMEAGAEYISWMVFKGYKVTENVTLLREGCGMEITKKKLNRKFYFQKIY